MFFSWLITFMPGLKATSTHMVIDTIADATYYFLLIMLAYTAAMKGIMIYDQKRLVKALTEILAENNKLKSIDYYNNFDEYKLAEYAQHNEQCIVCLMRMKDEVNFNVTENVLSIVRHSGD